MQRLITILATALAVTFCIQVFSDNKADVDLWGNVGFVQHLPWHAEFHRTNTFSYTDTEHPWVNHEWLAEYILHVTHRHAGNAGMLGLKLLLGLATVGLMSFSMREDGCSGPVRLLYSLLIVSTMGYGFSTRPHLFTYLFVAIFLLLIKRWPRRRGVILVLMPALGILWVNLHGAFFIGALLLTLHVVLEQLHARRQGTGRAALPLLAAPVLFIGASLVNPYGPRLWSFIAESASTVRPYLSEWAALAPARDFWSHVDFMVLALLTLLAFAFSRQAKNVTWTVFLGLSLLAALAMRRNIPLFALTAGFAAAAHVEAVAGPPLARILARVPRRLLIIVLAAFIPLSAVYALTFSKSDPLDIEIPPRQFPADMIVIMKEAQIRGNAIVFFDWAEYVIWHLYPACHVFLDGRFRSAYAGQTIEDYLDFLYVRKTWDRALTEYPTDIVLVHVGNPVFQRMLERPGWELIATTQIAALFLKKSVHSELIANLARNPVSTDVTIRDYRFP